MVTERDSILTLHFCPSLKNTLDKRGFAGAVLKDLSKAFDTINHELLIAKLNAYGFSEPSLKLIYNYLKDRLQHIKINSKEKETGNSSKIRPLDFEKK